MSDTFLVTGGAGFIGTNFVRLLHSMEPETRIVVLDDLTYCGNYGSIADVVDGSTVVFVKGDIADRALVERIFADYRPQYVINFAAESHVDRSLTDSLPFVRTNVEGTVNLLDCARAQRAAQLAAGEEPSLVRFLHVSTDEVYGDLPCDVPEGRPIEADAVSLLGRDDFGVMYGSGAFEESMPLRPSSPYSASKASADMFVQSYGRSFGLPVVITRCSNNYGPYQYPEKLIPLMVNNILARRPLPVYGRGLNVRDWIYVDDHARGILAVARRGRDGEVYNLGGYSERRNIDIVRDLIRIVAGEVADNQGMDESLITYVADRPGHDRRYAIDARKSMTELGWRPEVDFTEGLRRTVRWYLDNRPWLDAIVSGDYRDYYSKMYSNR